MKQLRIALIAGVSLLGALASGDVTVVSTMISTGATAQPGRVVTTYYKGNTIRIDTGDGVWIMNASDHKTYVLHPNDKTYTELTMNALAPGATDALKGVKIKSKASVKTTKDERTIAGKLAHKYIGDIQMTATADQMPGFSERMVVKMEIWATTEVQPTISTENMSAVIGQMFAGLGSFGDMSSIMGELAKVKGLPLSSSTTMTMSMTEPSPRGRKPLVHSMKMGYMTETRSVTEGDLDPALFQIPAGYTLSTKPLVPTPSPQ